MEHSVKFCTEIYQKLTYEFCVKVFITYVNIQKHSDGGNLGLCRNYL
jgi:hypothetical protein